VLGLCRPLDSLVVVISLCAKSTSAEYALLRIPPRPCDRALRARANELLTRGAAMLSARPAVTRAERPLEVVDATPTLRAFLDRYAAGHIDIAIKPSTRQRPQR
jgi:hypothetical protein